MICVRIRVSRRLLGELALGLDGSHDSHFGSVFGGHAKVMDLGISDKSLGFKAPDPETGEIGHYYYYYINGLAENVILDLYPDNNVDRLQQDHKIDEILFDLGAIKLEQAAVRIRRTEQSAVFKKAKRRGSLITRFLTVC
jgi:hypothetical protein